MEAEERPTKLRKLEMQENSPAEEADAPLLAKVNASPNEHLDDSSLQNSKPQERAANLADAAEEDEDPDSSSGVELETVNRRNPDPADHERRLLQQQQQQQQDGETSQPLSKNQLKKLRKREEWEAGRDYRKAKRKQKTQERKARKREATDQEIQLLQQQSPSTKAPDGEGRSKIAKAMQAATATATSRRRTLLPITILIDCGFDELMMEKERISLGSQLTRAYSDNHRAPYQAHLVISSWGGLLKERFDTVLNKHYLNWKGVRFEEGDFVEVAKKMEVVMRDPEKGGKLVGCFEQYAASANAKNGDAHAEDHASHQDVKVASSSSLSEETGNADINGHAEPRETSTTQNPESAQQHHQPPSSDPTTTTQPSAPQPQGETIYLTSDSPHTLTTLRPHSTYIIGGLVDKNRHKALCYKTACQRGIKTAKLPIGEYLEMSSRKVLATNHVVEILLRWMEEVGNEGEEGAWGRAFLRVMPKRKGGRLKGQGSGDGGGDIGGKKTGAAVEEDDDDVEEADQEAAVTNTVEEASEQEGVAKIDNATIETEMKG